MNIANQDDEGMKIASLVNALFTTYRKPDGTEYSNSDVIRGIGYKLSPSYLAKLRRGEVRTPGRMTLLELSRFFDAPIAHFFPELRQDEIDPSGRQQLQAALRSMGITPEARAYLEGLINVLQKNSTDRTESG